MTQTFNIFTPWLVPLAILEYPLHYHNHLLCCPKYNPHNCSMTDTLEWVPTTMHCVPSSTYYATLCASCMLPKCLIQNTKYLLHCNWYFIHYPQYIPHRLLFYLNILDPLAVPQTLCTPSASYATFGTIYTTPVHHPLLWWPCYTTIGTLLLWSIAN